MRIRPSKLHPKGTYGLLAGSAIFRLIEDWIPELVRESMPVISGQIFWSSMVGLLVGLLWADLSNPGSILRSNIRKWFALFSVKPSWPRSEELHTLHITTELTMRKAAKNVKVLMIVHRIGPQNIMHHELSTVLGEVVDRDKDEKFEVRLVSVSIEGPSNQKWCNGQNLLGQGRFVISIRMTAKRRISQTHKIYLEMLNLSGGAFGRFFVFDEQFTPFEESQWLLENT